ncbi:small polypeptide DEVIL 11 [Lactuca sativa]|uniref:small polypeptide DEVIL 11 n=1 Tax=Lactuca sativa TaxID=4236 RepID=UPI000CC5B720|nr:small polypeptide DEVIL 11 [Lactuca sativa]
MVVSVTTVDAPPPPQPQFTCSDNNQKLSKKGSISRSRSSSATSSHRRCTFTRKCARLVKEQRARFYIMRRCVSMLVCWRDYSDS